MHSIVLQVTGTAQQVFEWGGEGGANEECLKEVFFWTGGGHAGEFLFSFSKVTENAIIKIKLLKKVAKIMQSLLTR